MCAVVPLAPGGVGCVDAAPSGDGAAAQPAKIITVRVAAICRIAALCKVLRRP